MYGYLLYICPSVYRYICRRAAGATHGLKRVNPTWPGKEKSYYYYYYYSQYCCYCCFYYCYFYCYYYYYYGHYYSY